MNYWACENEWRILYHVGEPDHTELYLDHKYHYSQIKSMTFGCKTDDSDFRQIQEIAYSISPSIEFDKVEKMKTKFALSLRRN